MKVKEESEKVGLKINIQKTKIMTTGPITSWEIDEETVETVSGFILGGSKIIADSECSHEIKRCLLLGRKVMTNLDSILKITLMFKDSITSLPRNKSLFISYLQSPSAVILEPPKIKVCHFFQFLHLFSMK